MSGWQKKLVCLKGANGRDIVLNLLPDDEEYDPARHVTAYVLTPRYDGSTGIVEAYSNGHREHYVMARASLDEDTCSTIEGARQMAAGLFRALRSASPASRNMFSVAWDDGTPEPQRG